MMFIELYYRMIWLSFHRYNSMSKVYGVNCLLDTTKLKFQMAPLC